MGLVVCIVLFLTALLVGRRSLGHGVGFVLGVGYFYGVARAQLNDSYAHFFFDSAVLGLYLSHFFGQVDQEQKALSQPVRPWLLGLIFLPVLMVLLAPIIGRQPVLIQLVGLRAAVFMLPFLILGTRVGSADLDDLGRWILVLNVGAAAMALLEISIGVDVVFPAGETTDIVLRSRDVTEQSFYRIPAGFVSAHAYGGAMVATLGYLLRRWELGLSGWSTGIVLGLTVLGVFLCGARTPVAQLLIIAVLLLVSLRFQARTLTVLVVTTLVTFYVVSETPRMQRFFSLQDVDSVTQRMSGSFNVNLSQTLLEYPLGAGLGSAWGTSIPYFLRSNMQPQIGAENEYVRIAIEQGILGLVLWVMFLLWVALRGRPRTDVGGVFDRWLWLSVVVGWSTAFLGTGMFTSIPQTMLLMLHMGYLTRDSSILAEESESE